MRAGEDTDTDKMLHMSACLVLQAGSVASQTVYSNLRTQFVILEHKFGGQNNYI